MAESTTKEKINYMKYVSLVALTLQNSFVALSLRHGRTRVEKERLFFSSTAVAMTELVKLITCLVIVFFEENKSFKQFGASLYQTIIQNKIDTLKVCVPALLYVLQNNLLYLAASHLDAATYQVSFQVTIITTAFFAVLMLRKKLMITQWGALYFLIAGISIIQLTDQKKVTINSLEQNRLLGFGAALGGCVLSGFTSIYFEKILKGADISLWMRNVQMSLLSIPLGIGTCFASDFNNITSKGFFHGYDWFVVYLILLQACGGLLIGLVMRYADNILKGFATSTSIIISCIASVYLFDFDLTAQFGIGVMIVVGSIYLYGHVPKLPKPRQPQEMAELNKTSQEMKELNKISQEIDIEKRYEIVVENGKDSPSCKSLLQTGRKE